MTEGDPPVKTLFILNDPAGCCGTCMDARGIDDESLTEGTRRSTLDELAEWTLWADKVVTF